MSASLYLFPDDEVATSAKVIRDSISPAGHRLTTMVVTFHRFVLAEFNTHRMFSRSSASSRAIPIWKTLAKVQGHPAWPLEWACEMPGMQGGKELTGYSLSAAQMLFEDIAKFTIGEIEVYLGALEHEFPDEEERKANTLHKSLLNRLLEPFLWHTVIVTSTEWNNYFRQRASTLAQPEIRTVAEMMLAEFDASTPSLIGLDDWHLPFITDDELLTEDPAKLRAMSTARCARVSHLNHDGTYSEAADLKLFERLCDPGDGPPHAAPLEHVATPDPGNQVQVMLANDGRVRRLPDDGLLAADDPRAFSVPLLGNFLGWTQLRHQVLKF